MMHGIGRRLRGSSFGARFSRYTAGSIVAFVASEATLLLCYGVLFVAQFAIYQRFIFGDAAALRSLRPVPLPVHPGTGIPLEPG